MGEAVYLKTSCLKCGGSVEFPEEAENSTVPCPHCGKDLFLYRVVRAVGETAAAVPKPKSAEKMIFTTCDSCGAYFGFPESRAGGIGWCQACGRQTFLPYGAPAGQPPANQPTIQKPPSNSPTQQQISGAPAPANPNDALIGQALIGILAGIIAAFGIDLACLLASKMGWEGLDRFVSWSCFNLRSLKKAV